jgi:hypothetical protein
VAYSSLTPEQQARLRARSSSRTRELEAMGLQIVRRAAVSPSPRVVVREVVGSFAAITPAGLQKGQRASHNGTIANLDDRDERQQWSFGDRHAKTNRDEAYVTDHFDSFDSTDGGRAYVRNSGRWDDDSF